MNALDSQFRQKYRSRQQLNYRNKSRWRGFVAVAFFVFSLVSNVKTIEALTWQQALAQNFDIADTFDELQDWTGSSYSDVINQNDMPKKQDGSSSIWQYYSYYNNDYSNRWIANHGSQNVFGGSGKSLIIDYNGNKGPSRLGSYIGDGVPTSGYDEVYVFEMVKIPSDFFRRLDTDDTKFSFFNYMKFLKIATGFRDIWNWGTVEEQNASDNNVQVRNIYGQNFLVLNIFSASGTSNELVIQYNPRTSNSDGTSYVNLPFQNTLAKISQFILSNEWFGIEYRVNRGTVNVDNGEFEVWIYDKYGTIVTHDLLINRDHLNNFDHKYNKFVLGGNRFEQDFVGTSSYLYLDDIIINNQRIGPKYFSLLNGITPLKGDVQCDKVVDILDAQALVNCILGTGNCDWGCGNSADVNQDESIDVLDVQEVVNVILRIG